MGILPIILLILGIIFLFLGWRWQNPSNDEAKTALKGFAYLRRELLQVQDQVQSINNKILDNDQKEFLNNELIKINSMEQNKNKNIGLNKEEITESDIARLGENPQLQDANGNSQQLGNMSSRYQEVLVLDEKGKSIPEIAQQLSMSQDEVMMVLRTHKRGGTQ